MGICVEVSGGAIVESVDVYPACSQYAIVTAERLDRLTYWADVAIALDPAGTALYDIMTATMLVFAIAFGWRVLARQLFNR